jgi:Domain of unknown function (DUF4440)
MKFFARICLKAFAVIVFVVPAWCQGSNDQQQIITTVKTIFVAAKADDLHKFNSVLAPGFYIYDGGQRFDGDSVMKPIEAQYAAGTHYEWNVTRPDVHIYGDNAWIGYVNQGSISNASGTIDQTWLESAFLHKYAGQWKIEFIHSTRVTPKTSFPVPVTK